MPMWSKDSSQPIRLKSPEDSVNFVSGINLYSGGVAPRKEYSLSFPDSPPYCAWLGNLSTYTTEKDIIDYFFKFQLLPSDIRFGRRKGPHTCAYVDFCSSNDLLKALQYVKSPNPALLCGRKIQIDIADGILHSRIRAINMANINSELKLTTNNSNSSNETHSPISSSVLSLSTSSTLSLNSSSSVLTSSSELKDKVFLLDTVTSDKKKEMIFKKTQRNLNSNWRNASNVFFNNNINIDNSNNINNSITNQYCIDLNYGQMYENFENTYGYYQQCTTATNENTKNNASAKRYLYDVSMIKYPMNYKTFSMCIMISRPYSYYYFYCINNYLQLLYYPQQPVEMNNKNILYFYLLPADFNNNDNDNDEFPCMRIQVYYRNMNGNDNKKFLTWSVNDTVTIKNYEHNNQQLWKLIKYNNNNVDWYKIVSVYNNNYELYVDHHFILGLRQRNENINYIDKNSFFQFLSKIV